MGACGLIYFCKERIDVSPPQNSGEKLEEDTLKVKPEIEGDILFSINSSTLLQVPSTQFENKAKRCPEASRHCLSFVQM